MNEDEDDRVVDEPEWAWFAQRAAAYCRTMVEGDRITFHVPGAESQEVSISVQHDVWFRVDAPWASENDDLFGEYDLWEGDAVDDLADDLVDHLRSDGGLPHPSLLTVSASGPASCGVGVLRLAQSAHVEADLVTGDGPRATERLTVLSPVDRDHLVRVLSEHLVEHYDDELEPDDDGDFALSVRGTPVWVRVMADQPSVVMFTPVLRDVRSRRQTDAELNVLNRDSVWSRWTRRERMVWHEMAVPGRPFIPTLFDNMLELFVQTQVSTRPDLVDRLRGVS